MIKQTVLYLAQWMPLRLGEWVCRLWIKSVAHHRDPRRALEHAFRLEQELDHVVNRLAIRHDGGVHTKHRHTKYHDFFTHRIQPGERVADIGCGIGELARDIAQRCQATVVAIDNDPAKLELSQKHAPHPRVTYLYQDALDWSPDQRFDVVVISNVLEHIDRRVEFLKRAQSVLRPKRWLIRVPRFDRDWRVPLKRDLGLAYFCDDTHFTEYTPEDFEQEMQQAGMVITHLESRWAEIWAEVRHDSVPDCEVVVTKGVYENASLGAAHVRHQSVSPPGPLPDGGGS